MEEKKKRGRIPTGRLTLFKTFSVSCYPGEYEKLKAIAKREGLSMARLLVDTVLDKYGDAAQE